MKSKFRSMTAILVIAAMMVACMPLLGGDTFTARAGSRWTYDMSQYLYNGNKTKLRIEIVERHTAQTVPIETNRNDQVVRTAQELTVFDSAGDYITSCRYDSVNTPWQIELNTAGEGMQYKDGKIHFRIYYDGMYFFTVVKNIRATSEGKQALKIAEKAINYNGGSRGNYVEDMENIKTALWKNYSHNDISCIDGAYVLFVWSLKKYGISGYVGEASGGSNHYEFYPARGYGYNGPFPAEGKATSTASGWPLML